MIPLVITNSITITEILDAINSIISFRPNVVIKITISKETIFFNDDIGSFVSLNTKINKEIENIIYKNINKIINK